MCAQCIVARALLADGDSGTGRSIDVASSRSVSTNDANEREKIPMLKLWQQLFIARKQRRTRNEANDSHEMHTRDRHENHSGFPHSG
jgi:hypothetical protein